MSVALAKASKYLHPLYQSLLADAAHIWEAWCGRTLENRVPGFILGAEGASADCGILVNQNFPIPTDPTERLYRTIRFINSDHNLVALDCKTIHPVILPQWRGGGHRFSFTWSKTQTLCFAFLIVNPQAPHMVAVVPSFYLRQTPGESYHFDSLEIPSSDREIEPLAMELSPFHMPEGPFMDQCLCELQEFVRGQRATWRNPYLDIEFSECPAPVLRSNTMLLPDPASGLGDLSFIGRLWEALSNDGQQDWSIERLMIRPSIGDFAILHTASGTRITVELKERIAFLRENRIRMISAMSAGGHLSRRLKPVLGPQSRWDFLLLLLTVPAKTAFLCSRDEVPQDWFNPVSADAVTLEWSLTRRFIKRHTFSTSSDSAIAHGLTTILQRYQASGRLRAQTAIPFSNATSNVIFASLRNHDNIDEGIIEEENAVGIENMIKNKNVVENREVILDMATSTQFVSPDTAAFPVTSTQILSEDKGKGKATKNLSQSKMENFFSISKIPPPTSISTKSHIRETSTLSSVVDSGDPTSTVSTERPTASTTQNGRTMSTDIIYQNQPASSARQKVSPDARKTNTSSQQSDNVAVTNSSTAKNDFIKRRRASRKDSSSKEADPSSEATLFNPDLAEFPLIGTTSHFSRLQWQEKQYQWLLRKCEETGYGAVYRLTSDHPSAAYAFAPIEWKDKMPSFFDLSPETPMMYINFANVNILDKILHSMNRRYSGFWYAKHGECPSIYILVSEFEDTSRRPEQRYIVPSLAFEQDYTPDRRDDFLLLRGKSLVLDAFAVPEHRVPERIRAIFAEDFDTSGTVFIGRKAQTKRYGLNIDLNDYVVSKRSLCASYLPILCGKKSGAPREPDDGNGTDDEG